MKGNKNHNFGKRPSEETIAKIREAAYKKMKLNVLKKQKKKLVIH